MQTFEEFKRLSEGANLVPVVRKLMSLRISLTIS